MLSINTKLQIIKNLQDANTEILKEIQNKGYTLDGYSFNDYDINSVIEHNLKNYFEKCVSKFNVLNLKNTPEPKVYKKDNSLKDFAEVENEVKEYFKQFKPKDRLKELFNQRFSLNNYLENALKVRWYYEVENIFNSVEELKTKLNEVIKNNLKFNHYINNYYETYKMRDVLYNINELCEIVLNKSFDYTKFKDTNDLNISEHINELQDIFKIKVFKNGKYELKFNDVKDFEKIKESLINEEVENYNKRLLEQLNRGL